MKIQKIIFIIIPLINFELSYLLAFVFINKL